MTSDLESIVFLLGSPDCVERQYLIRSTARDGNVTNDLMAAPRY